MELNKKTFDELEAIYKENFSMCYLGKDISNKFALIGLTCYLSNKLQEKDHSWTHLKILNKLNKAKIGADVIAGLAVICSDFAYGCNQFPNFGLKDKEIPSKITELLNNYIPF